MGGTFFLFFMIYIYIYIYLPQFAKNTHIVLCFINNNKKTILHSAITEKSLYTVANSKTLTDHKTCINGKMAR